jgi:periplasmic protein TonB
MSRWVPVAPGKTALHWAVALSVAVHALAWAMTTSTSARLEADPRPAHAGVAVRWVNAGPAPQLPSRAAASGSPGVSNDTDPLSSASVPMTAMDTPGTQPVAAPPVLDQPVAATPAAVQAAVPEPSVSSAAGLAGHVDGYLPRKLLTTPPRPLAEITMRWPPGMLPLGRQAGLFTLFIDEAGRVRRMIPDDRSLSPPLEAAAREVFSAAEFLPGELDGRPVKSIIRIEVVYESTVPAPAGARTATPVIVSRQNL